MDQNELKRQVAKAALSFIDDDCILGVGTGSTVNCLIDALSESGIRIEAAVSSSEESTHRLQEIGVKVVDLNTAGPLDLYIDGADE
ncbi:MAG: ribose-5-phosphate isomerase A, partial [Proteobacteria bacterium]|nr:ribose-5-phosphate isomerase A [Pseudomonadota bacterium]